jgi:hypothetical protein
MPTMLVENFTQKAVLRYRRTIFSHLYRPKFGRPSLHLRVQHHVFLD